MFIRSIININKRLFSSLNFRYCRKVHVQGDFYTRSGSVNMNSVDYFTITGCEDNEITFYKSEKQPFKIFTVIFENNREAVKEYNNILEGKPSYTGF